MLAYATILVEFHYFWLKPGHVSNPLLQAAIKWLWRRSSESWLSKFVVVRICCFQLCRNNLLQSALQPSRSANVYPCCYDWCSQLHSHFSSRESTIECASLKRRPLTVTIQFDTKGQWRQLCFKSRIGHTRVPQQSKLKAQSAILAN